jgi:hypothetical protein
MSSENAVLFKKLKLVPADELPQFTNQHVVGQVEKYLRNYNPTVRAMANSYTGMGEALHGKKKRSTSNKLNLFNSNKARYLQLLKSTSSSADVPPPMEMPVNVESQQQQQQELKARPLDVEDTDKKHEVKPLLAIPAKSQDKFEAVLEIAGGAIKPGKHGEVVIEGKALPNTSYSDVMRALFVNSRKSPKGLGQTVAELKRLGVPMALLKSKTAMDLYKKAEAGQGQLGSGRRIQKVKTLGKAKKMKKNSKVLRLY